MEVGNPSVVLDCRPHGGEVKGRVHAMNLRRVSELLHASIVGLPCQSAACILWASCYASLIPRDVVQRLQCCCSPGAGRFVPPQPSTATLKTESRHKTQSGSDAARDTQCRRYQGVARAKALQICSERLQDMCSSAMDTSFEVT